ncbi:F-box protein-like protein [Salvia divinorum]|uniref:F-box protein-like protein n=1 Tax=Salvia divinorum TaxID=28513 RepID=A0ABD1FPF8_SALDI
MGRHDFFTNLPSEITTDILSRLSIRSLAISKSVCKAWHDLFDFTKSKIKTHPTRPSSLDIVGPGELNSLHDSRN